MYGPVARRYESASSLILYIGSPTQIILCTISNTIFPPVAQAHLAFKLARLRTTCSKEVLRRRKTFSGPLPGSEFDLVEANFSVRWCVCSTSAMVLRLHLGLVGLVLLASDNMLELLGIVSNCDRAVDTAWFASTGAGAENWNGAVWFVGESSGNANGRVGKSSIDISALVGTSSGLNRLLLIVKLRLKSVLVNLSTI